MPAAESHALALESFRKGNYADALYLLTDALAEEETGERWNDWATTHLAAHHPAIAERGFRRALNLDPDNLQIALNLGVLLATQERAREALPLLERAEPAAKPDEKPALASLLDQCRRSLRLSPAAAGATPSTAGASVANAALLQEVRRVIAPQVTTLNNIALRLITIEGQLANLASPQNHDHGAASSAFHGGAPPTQFHETDVIPKVAMSEVFLSRLTMKIAAPAQIESSVSLPELCLLVHLMLRAKARTIFEIGTSVGRTALNFALNSPPAARIFTLDLPRGTQRQFHYRAGSLFHRTPPARKIRQLYGDSLHFDFSHYFDSSDFVFIDGSHAYAHALSDTHNALRLLRRGRGVIAWHDYGWEGVAPALNKFFREDKRLACMRHIEGTSLVFAHLHS